MSRFVGYENDNDYRISKSVNGVLGTVGRDVLNIRWLRCSFKESVVFHMGRLRRESRLDEV